MSSNRNSSIKKNDDQSTTQEETQTLSNQKKSQVASDMLNFMGEMDERFSHDMHSPKSNVVRTCNDLLGPCTRENVSTGTVASRLRDELHVDPVKTLSFPSKLHAILSNEQINDVVSWMPHGRSWRVHKPKVFESNVIPMFFHRCKYSSFIRQVNGWGFCRITQGRDRNSYWNKSFLRGRPNLCENMHRPAKSQKPPSDPSNEPNFYILPDLESISGRSRRLANSFPNGRMLGKFLPPSNLPIPFNASICEPRRKFSASVPATAHLSNLNTNPHGQNYAYSTDREELEYLHSRIVEAEQRERVVRLVENQQRDLLALRIMAHHNSQRHGILDMAQHRSQRHGLLGTTHQRNRELMSGDIISALAPVQSRENELNNLRQCQLDPSYLRKHEPFQPNGVRERIAEPSRTRLTQESLMGLLSLGRMGGNASLPLAPQSPRNLTSYKNSIASSMYTENDVNLDRLKMLNQNMLLNDSRLSCINAQLRPS